MGVSAPHLLQNKGQAILKQTVNTQSKPRTGRSTSSWTLTHIPLTRLYRPNSEVLLTFQTWEDHLSHSAWTGTIAPKNLCGFGGEKNFVLGCASGEEGNPLIVAEPKGNQLGEDKMLMKELKFLSFHFIFFPREHRRKQNWQRIDLQTGCRLPPFAFKRFQPHAWEH